MSSKIAKIIDHRCSVCGADFTKSVVFEEATYGCSSKLYWNGKEWESDDFDLYDGRDYSYQCSECGAKLEDPSDLNSGDV